MISSLLTIIFIQSWYSLIIQPSTQAQIPGSRPAFDDKPAYTDSYIPPSMQVIFHLTDLMKYDISAINKPQKPPKMTTTTVRSTSSHKPGIFAPSPPTTIRSELNENSTDTLNNKPSKVSLVDSNQLMKEILYLALVPQKILSQIGHIDDEDSDFVDDADNNFNVEKFLKDYDDNLHEEFLRLPRVAPTSAYVSLLSLYDSLNKEAKRQGLNKFNGYSAKVLESLINTSSGSAIDQLKFVLNKMLENSDTKTPDVLNKTKRLLIELDRSDGLIAKAIRYYPPMKFGS